MRIVVDAMCAEYGGIRTYVEHLLSRWADEFPDDELHVVVPAGMTLPTAGHTRHELAVPRPGTLGRPWVQSTRMRRLVARLQPDAVLATAPNTSLRRLGAPLLVMIHDLRHELRPEQFSRGRRLLRRVSYSRSYALADGFVTNSRRTLDDLHDLHPDTRDRPGVVGYLGADHVLDWPAPDRSGPAVTFAHHTNKNPGLVLEAWSLLAAGPGPVPRLMMLGVSGDSRARLDAEIAARGLTERVQVSRFLPDDEFVEVLSRASMIVFPSDFEGFGLPVAEGMSLGKPVVIGPDKGTTEVAGGHAVVMGDWTAAALADAVASAAQLSADHLEAARAWGMTFTWGRTVRETRAALASLAERRVRGG